MRTLLMLMALAVIAIPATVSACSLPEGASIPTCPEGQVFDTAASCGCVPTKAEVQEPATTIEQHWFNCSSNNDCVSTDDACKNPTSVNKNYLEQYNQAAAKQAPLVECAPAAPRGMVSQSICEAGRCKAVQAYEMLDTDPVIILPAQ